MDLRKNQKYSLLIVDDDMEDARKTKDAIERYFKNLFSIEIMDDKKAYQILQMQSYDLYVLDIQMPNHSGFKIADIITKKQAETPLFIFLSLYEEFSTASYDFEALHFLLKERFPEKLDIAINRALKILRTRRNYIDVTNKDGIIIKIPLLDIIYANANSNYIDIVTSKGIYYKRTSIKKFLEEYQNFPFATPRSGILVNINAIDKIDECDFIHLKDEKITFKISRGKKAEFYKRLSL